MNNIDCAYGAIAHDPKYQHFVMIPQRIVRCMEYFGIGSDRIAVRNRLLAFYLFIGVVDHAIDAGDIETGTVVLDRFKMPPCLDNSATVSDALLMTEILKSHVPAEIQPLIFDLLHELYQEVLRERTAISIDSYIEQRRIVGRLTAASSYLLICPLLEGEHKEFGEFMQQVGEVGCLIDSIIDLKSDRRLGLIGFDPALSDFSRLVFCTLRAGILLALHHPRLIHLFFQAINDSIQDLFRRQPASREPRIAAERKDAASVA